METLQEAYLHAVAAAARCSIAKPNRDRGIDWIVSHQSTFHSHDWQADLRVQLKSTYQVTPSTVQDSVPISIPNAQLRRLAFTPVTNPAILVAMLVPRKIEDWIDVQPEHLLVRHTAFWINLEGHPVTGRDETVIRVFTSRVFDAESLCEMMQRIGAGGKP